MKKIKKIGVCYLIFSLFFLCGTFIIIKKYTQKYIIGTVIICKNGASIYNKYQEPNESISDKLRDLFSSATAVKNNKKCDENNPNDYFLSKIKSIDFFWNDNSYDKDQLYKEKNIYKYKVDWNNIIVNEFILFFILFLFFFLVKKIFNIKK